MKVHGNWQKALLLVVCSVNLYGQTAEKPRYKDPEVPMAERVSDLLNRMTLEEKVAQLESAINRPHFPGSHMESAIENGQLNFAYVDKHFSNGLGTYGFIDEFNGLAGDAKDGARNRNLLQHWMVEHTRLGIPILFHGEGLHGAVIKGATSFPQAIGLGSTWDPQLLQTMYTSVAEEERGLGNTLVLGPLFDLIRDPRYGRVEEMYSEDPYLVAQLGIAAVVGLQGDGESLDSRHVFATAKHFVHGQPENGTNGGPSDYSELTMRSVFLYPFEQAVKKAKLAAVMPSYNENMGGIPSNANSWLLKEILRKEWNYQGLTISDYGAISQLSDVHKVAPNVAAAGVLAFQSGDDMELPEASAFPALIQAVSEKKISESDLNQSVERVLWAKFRAGLFDHPWVDTQLTKSAVGAAEHAKLARRVADESIVLLKNQNNTLPLKAESLHTIAVIGPNANKVRLGDYSGMPSYFVTILDGIKSRVEKNTTVLYAEGCRISEPDTASNLNTFANYKSPDPDMDRQLMQEAVETARRAEIVILALGGNEVVSREATGDTGMGYSVYGDSDSLALPGRQDELVDLVSAAGKPMIAVLLNGKPYSIEALSNRASAILEGWYLGQETGNAIAGVLFGDVNPSGHLPVSIARNVGQLPVFYYKTPNARVRYVNSDNQPLYPFGYGLSYTKFSFSKPRVSQDAMRSNQSISATVDVTNQGDRVGDDIAQMYIHHVVSSVVQPVKILRGFQRVHLEPHETKTVTFEVGPEQLSITNAKMQRVVESGPVDILMGDNSSDTSAVQVIVTEP